MQRNSSVKVEINTCQETAGMHSENKGAYNKFATVLKAKVFNQISLSVDMLVYYTSSPLIST